ncbi:class I SAM-dependent methyltransferase, partial [Ancylomarina sp. 16SWW S1-10-2]|uniref:class I SAM-dependent methyltransferase n=1 Tax=Ancylomarina sp. 16SWW S1-10-2 TaxID=2499681 RepID=UPI00189D6630
VAIDDIALDYAKTLAAWRDGFFENIDQVRKQGFNEVFIRMWDFYLAYCEGGFRERTISTVQMVMAKPRCQHLPVVAR